MKDSQIKSILKGFDNYNKAKKYSWPVAIKGHLNWSKSAANAAQNPARAQYARSINYSSSKATDDANRLLGNYYGKVKVVREPVKEFIKAPNLSGGITFGNDQSKALIPIILASSVAVVIAFGSGLFKFGSRKRRRK